MMIMNKANTLYDSIELERHEFEQIKTQADLVIDTTLLKRTALQDRLEASFITKQEKHSVSLLFHLGISLVFQRMLIYFLM